MHQYSELLRAILEKRGIKTAEEADVFLNPDYERDFHDPFLMRDMEKACVKLFETIEAGEKTVIYADYDADGIPGAVILKDLFEKVGYKNYEVYIPMRNSEGYGLNMEAIKGFSEKGVKLLITIDLGITAVEEVAQAEVEGIEVIITDHHLPKFLLPKAFAILNPKADEYPEKMLCGAGVVFKFVQGFVKKYGEYFDQQKAGWEKWLLDMAGLATLSDMVPLLGENRAIAYFGMKVLRKSPRPGLQKLLAKMKIEQKYLSEDDIGYMLTPRLNAASRMDDPMRAYELLAASDEREAGSLADHLSKINDERKNIVTNIMREANKTFEKREFAEVIVVGNPKWRVGVLGLVAGKLCDLHKRPVFVWGKDENDLIKGSCRGDGSVSIVKLMSETSGYFADFGGHEQAGGFTVLSDKIHFLEEALSESYKKITLPLTKGEVPKAEGVEADIIGDLSMVDKKTWRELEKLAPFGFGNPKPVFLFKNIQIEKIKKFGKNGSGEHLEIIFKDDSDKKVKAVSFFSDLDSFSAHLEENVKMDLLATMELSRFLGKEELRLRMIDVF